MKQFFVIFTVITTIMAANAQNNSAIDWVSDIEFVKNELPAKHKNLNFKVPKELFESDLNSLSQQLGKLSDLEIAVRLQQIIAKMGDSHTVLDYRPFIDVNYLLPLKLYWFKDGIYIFQTSKDYENILGKKIISLNGFSIQTIIDSLSTLITIDNQALVKNQVPGLIPLAQLHNHFGFANGNNFTFEIASSLGEKEFINIPAGPVNNNDLVAFQADSLAPCWRNQRSFFSEQYFDQFKTYYIQYNTCWSKEIENQYGNREKAANLPSFMEFEEKVFSTLKNQYVKKFVFDMRFNSGGNSEQGTNFVNKLNKLKHKNKNMQIYVIIGRKTFSSAIINTMDFKQNTNAILLGEETGGKPNHFGEIKSIKLPSSGLELYYSTKYFSFTIENTNTITPDTYLEPTFFDYKSGIDPVFDWIIKQ
ncbi:MAG: hypothetical protein GX587_07260 [Bacteroidales bacterium]|nr:hypothetical protein [Bacteroidales bacterium]